MSASDEKFGHLDLLLDSLGHEMERGSPEIGVLPSALHQDSNPGLPLDEAPSEAAGPVSELSEDELMIEEMLAELDTPGGGSSGDDGAEYQGAFLDLGGGSQADDEDDDESEVDLASAPEWEDDEEEAPEPEEDMASILASAPEWEDEEEAPEPEEDMASILASAPEWEDEEEPPKPDEALPSEPDLGDDLDALLTPDQDLADPGDDFLAELGSLPEDESPIEPLEGVQDLPDELGLPEMGELDSEMSEFLGELESAGEFEAPAGEEMDDLDDLDSLLSQEVDQATSQEQQLDSTISEPEPVLSDDFDEGAGLDDLLSAGGLVGEDPAVDPDLGFDALPEMDDFGEPLPEAKAEEAGLTGFDDVDLGFGAGVAVPTDSTPLDYSDEELELTDEDVERIRKRLLILTPRVRELASLAITEDRVSQQAQNKLVRMLLEKAPPLEIKAFLEKETGENLDEPLDEDLAFAAPGLPALPDSIPHGEGFFANLWPIIRIAALGIGVIVIGILLYLLLIKPGLTGAELMERGLASIGNEEYLDAEDYFKRGEAYLGQDIDWYREYAKGYAEKREYQRAINKLKDGLAFSPRDFDSLIMLGDNYAAAGEFETAGQTFALMERYFPKSLKVPEKMGDLHLAIGDATRNPTQYELARLEYKKIVEADWENLDGQFKTMLAYVKLKKLPEANEKYKHIRRIDEKVINVPVLTEYSALLQEHDDWFESRQLLGEILKKDWEHAPAHFYMSRYWREQLDQNKALLNLKHAIRIDRNNATYHNETGEVYLELPKPEIAEATRSFIAARELDPRYPQPYINLGHIYYEYLTPGDSGDLNLEEQNYQQALENYEKAINYLPVDYSDHRLFYSQGWLYYRQGRYDEALAAWRKIYAENPFHPTVSFAMGNAWLHLKKDVLAEAEHEKVVRYYEAISKKIPMIDPDLKRHQRVYGMLVNSYNNLGVAWKLRHQRTDDLEYEKRALLSFWKAREIADRLNRVGFEYPENNIGYITRPDVKRELAIAPELGRTTIPKYLDYERQ